MEDAVAVIPGFMGRTCDHVGGCMAPGSRTSSEISPVHFFGVYDGHGGSQVRYVTLRYVVLNTNSNCEFSFFQFLLFFIPRNLSR